MIMGEVVEEGADNGDVAENDLEGRVDKGIALKLLLLRGVEAEDDEGVTGSDTMCC